MLASRKWIISRGGARSAGLAEAMLGSCAIVARAERCVGVLLLEPAQEFLVTRVGLDFFNGVEVVAQLIVRPSFVDEIFAGAAGRRGFASAFAARDDVVFAGGDVAMAEGALFGFGLVAFVGHRFAGS